VNDITASPQPGWIGLTKIKGGVGLAIRIGQFLNGDGFSQYEHAFVYIGDGRIVEAEPGPAGAALGYLGEYDPDKVAWLECPARFGPAVADAARQMIGTPYSFLDYGALFLHRLHIPAPGLRDYIQASGHRICSQLADRAANLGGWHLFSDDRWEGYVTPGALSRLRRQLAAHPEGAAA
jgi:hypothetical protein